MAKRKRAQHLYQGEFATRLTAPCTKCGLPWYRHRVQGIAAPVRLNGPFAPVTPLPPKPRERDGAIEVRRTENAGRWLYEMTLPSGTTFRHCDLALLLDMGGVTRYTLRT